MSLKEENDQQNDFNANPVENEAFDQTESNTKSPIPENSENLDTNETKTEKIKSKYFDKDKIHEIVYAAVDKTLSSQVYKRDLAKKWIESVTESCMAHLNQYQQTKKEEYANSTHTPEDGLLPVVMKYMVHVVLLKKSPAVGFHSATSAIWDPTTDGMCSIAWENESMHCLVTVFEVNAI